MRRRRKVQVSIPAGKSATHAHTEVVIKLRRRVCLFGEKHGEFIPAITFAMYLLATSDYGGVVILVIFMFLYKMFSLVQSKFCRFCDFYTIC